MSEMTDLITCEAAGAAVVVLVVSFSSDSASSCTGMSSGVVDDVGTVLSVLFAKSLSVKSSLNLSKFIGPGGVVVGGCPSGVSEVCWTVEVSDVPSAVWCTDSSDGGKSKGMGALSAMIRSSALFNREDWARGWRQGCVSLSIKRSQSLELISVVVGDGASLMVTELGEEWRLDVSVDEGWGDESSAGVPKSNLLQSGCFGRKRRLNPSTCLTDLDPIFLANSLLDFSPKICISRLKRSTSSSVQQLDFAFALLAARILERWA